MKTTSEITDLTLDDDIDQSAQFSIIPIPEVTMMESRYDSKSRDSLETCNLKIAAAQSLNNFGPLDYANSESVDPHCKASTEVPNEVPNGSNITMLSSTSLLHGHCIFNRNNTVATQAGLKTYWLCKSYRISMCKARCITHQGKVISATGVHNHLPHMNSKPEIPPGHTPNVFNPSSSHQDFILNTNSMPSSSSQLISPQNAQSIMAQQPYHFLPHHISQPMMEQQQILIASPMNSRQSLHQQAQDENKITFNFDATSAESQSFKVEHL